MQTSTIAQGPLGLGGTYITIGSTIYNLQAGDDPQSYPEPLKAFLAAETLNTAVERELQSIIERTRARLRAQAGVQVVPAHAVMRAAERRGPGVLAAVRTWLTNNPNADLALKIVYGAENITKSELIGVSPAEGANIFDVALTL